MKKYFVANWKMYVEKQDGAKRFATEFKRRARGFSNTEVVIAPPFTLLSTVASAFSKSTSVKIGAQTISPYDDEKHTGDISGAMLKNSGVSHVIVGHSERRAAGETDETVRLQIERALAAGLTVILCVGEKERDPQGAYLNFVAEQLTSALKGKSGNKILVAYEPVWAIGKSAADAMKPADVQEMVIFIRKNLVDTVGREAALKVPILYGGSVEGENAATLMRDGGVAGFLVGHASAEADSFIEIIKALR